ncbi:MAG: sigma-54-dependent Fis family transcriptional regulator [Acidobacteria bacterium]|nr:sigma-54-dependent Fis family transcriptional regulator [Acidobacteriota bacterium]
MREEATTGPRPRPTLLNGSGSLNLVGDSSPFKLAKQQLIDVARYDVNVLLEGDTGTGKELFANLIHAHSSRHQSPIVAINCGAIPAELAESEFFGHLRGSFTGALQDRPGLVAQADRGSLFLDEISAMSLQVQAKLLRFLQNGEYRPVGSGRTHSADVRLVSACNTSLEEEAKKGSFRWDLLYRLRVVSIRIPPLKERWEDVGPLFRHFFRRYSAKFSIPPARLSPNALSALMEYEWPGNVRELENMAQLLAIRHAGGLVEPGDLPCLASGAPPAESRPDSKGSFQREREKVLETFERTYLYRLIKRHRGNVSQAAKEAGKDRRTLTRLLKKHEINAALFRSSLG